MNTIRKSTKVGLAVLVAGLAVFAMDSVATAGGPALKFGNGKFQFQISGKRYKAPKFVNKPSHRKHGYRVQRYQPRFVLPGDGHHHHPKQTLGFYGHVDPGHGMHVESVIHGSLADRIGLEAGDYIVEIDGYHIHCDADYHRALRHAHGRTSMLVEDAHGRGLVRVSFYWGHGGHGGHVH